MEIVKVFTEIKDGKARRMCVARCSCGDVSKYWHSNVTTENTKQCNDCAKNSRAIKRKTHGCSPSFKNKNPKGYSVYTIWQAIKRRCRKPYDKRYSDYGGRGIDVCDEWYDSFEVFYLYMGNRPSPSHQIDRTDNDKGYEPGNCKWVTRAENARNKRNNVILEIKGEKRCVSEWASISGAKADTVLMRIKRGWEPERAVFGNRHKRRYNTPNGEFRTLKEVQDCYGMSSSGVHGRFSSSSFPNWTIKESK